MDSWKLRRHDGVVLVCRSHYIEFDRVVLLSVECLVICQMQQLLVSMETTHGPFSVFSSSLCGAKAVGGRRKWWHLERGQSGTLIARVWEGKLVEGMSNM